MVLTIDLFQIDKTASKACEKVVRSYKTTVKNSLKIDPRQRQLSDKPKHGQTKYKIWLLFCEI